MDWDRLRAICHRNDSIECTNEYKKFMREFNSMKNKLKEMDNPGKMYYFRMGALKMSYTLKVAEIHMK